MNSDEERRDGFEGMPEGDPTQEGDGADSGLPPDLGDLASAGDERPSLREGPEETGEVFPFEEPAQEFDSIGGLDDTDGQDVENLLTAAQDPSGVEGPPPSDFGGYGNLPPDDPRDVQSKDKLHGNELLWKFIIHSCFVIITGLPLLIVALVVDHFYDGASRQYLFYLVAFGIEALVLFWWFLVGWPVKQRKWADGESRWVGKWSEPGQPMFWVRIPEMHAVFILRDKRLHRVLVSSSGPRSKYFKDWIRSHQKDYTKVVYEIVEPGKELVWIGVPWRHSIKTWYEDSQDAENAQTDPRGVLTLSERTMDWTPDESTSTADPIEVIAKLVISLLVVDPTKAVYSIQFYLEIIRKEIWAELRQVMIALKYFSISEEVESSMSEAGASASREEVEATFKRIELTVNPDLQQKLYRLLNDRLGFIGFQDEENDNPPLIYDDESKRLGELWPQFRPGSIVARIRDTYGVIISQPILIKDVDLADPALKAAVDMITKNRTEMINAVLKAESDRQSTARVADGEAYRIQKLGLPDGTALLLEQMLPGLISGSKLTFLGMEGVTQLFGLLSQAKNLIPSAATVATTEGTSQEGSE